MDVRSGDAGGGDHAARLGGATCPSRRACGELRPWQSPRIPWLHGGILAMSRTKISERFVLEFFVDVRCRAEGTLLFFPYSQRFNFPLLVV